jgi:ATP-dependent helicase/nuclease subunit A
VRKHESKAYRELAFTARFSLQELRKFMGRESETARDSEFVIVQGIADLVLVFPDQLWLIDFKTDEVPPEECVPKAKYYAPQVMLYARALSRMMNRPATASWLYFLGCGRAVQVSAAERPGAGGTTSGDA